MTNRHAKVQLPMWIAEAIAEGDPVSGVRNKRGEDRLVSALYCLIEPGGQAGEHVSAQVHNVSERGLGMIVRKPLRAGQKIQLLPGDGSKAVGVAATVVHCTQTVQGYKVGCEFVFDD